MRKRQEVPKNYVVAIGASAGGLEAINELFDNMPEETGFSFVIIQHLSPDYKSLMGELLSRHTSMQVYEAGDNMPLKPNCVYLIPSKKIITIKNGKLILQEKLRNHLPNTAIDIFLESLAKEKGKEAVAIILSGTGTDGTRGIEEIKNKGGLVIVQDPITASFDGMPNSAISSGCSDFILAPEMIPDELTNFLKEGHNNLNNWSSPKDESAFFDIIQLIRKTTQVDFTHYKRPTIQRRLARQMAEKNIKDLRDYYHHLQNNTQEIKLLSREFLINVTKFFRDKEAFDKIKTDVIPGIYSAKKANDPIKIWIVACSTGEEAYSMAILFQEYAERKKNYDKPIKIFATDIDEDALEQASKGLYSVDNMKDMPKEYIKKYFLEEGKNYRVSPALRKMVVFANHNIFKDPPFSRIDLVSCRNMLIYMSPMLQGNTLKAFHFALNSGGYLVLGPSENIGLLKNVLKDVDKKWKIYRCVAKAKLPEDQTLHATFNIDSIVQQQPAPKIKNALSNLAEIFKDTLLEEHKYAGILIDKNFEIKQAIGNFKSFLDFPDDHFNFNLLKLIPSDLSIAISTCVRKAIKEGEKVSLQKVKVYNNKIPRVVNIIVKPYLEQKDYLQPFLFIILNEEQEVVKITGKKANGRKGISSDAYLQELEKELRGTRENLQAVIEEMESTNEELQSSNEEIISSNEELQSTNEELQSLNEELHTVNAEHQQKIKELIELNDDMNNYFRNTDIGQVLIDKKLLVRKFTPAVTRQVNLIESDVGRSIIDISNNFKNLDFINDVKEVMKTGISVEKDVVMANNQVFQMRIAPYLRQEKYIDGVVVSFINITEIKKLNSLLGAVLDSSASGITAVRAVRSKDNTITDFEIIAANSMAEKIISNSSQSTLIGKRMSKEIGWFKNNYLPRFVQVLESGEPFSFNVPDSNKQLWYEVSVVKMIDGLVTTFTDVTQKKTAADLLEQSFENLKETSGQLQASNIKLEQSNLDLLQFASVASHDLKEPLRKIQAFGNILQSKIESKLTDDERNYFNKIIKASNRMQTLIEDVLTLSKLSNQELPYEAVDLNNVVAQILDDIEIAVKEKNAVIKIGKLPVIEAVPGQMHQLFQNLVSNALKFNDKAQPEIIISSAAVNKKEYAGLNGHEYVRVRVQDNGIGFDKEFKEKIFGIFQRLHGQQYNGSGIGLAICKKIAENHNGFITTDSKINSGSHFDVVLPLSKAV